MSSISRGMIGWSAAPRSDSEIIDEIARNVVLEFSGMTRVSSPDCISSDFLTAGGSRDRISWRIPFTLTADPSVASRGSDHSLISSGSSLFVFAFVLGWDRKGRASTGSLSCRGGVISAEYRAGGDDAGAENWATIASLVETCKLNAVDPLAYLTATLTAIVNGHKQSQIESLLPWNCLSR